MLFWWTSNSQHDIHIKEQNDWRIRKGYVLKIGRGKSVRQYDCNPYYYSGLDLTLITVKLTKILINNIDQA